MVSNDRVRMVRGFISKPPDPKLEEAKRKFEAINEFVTEHGGWLVSVPGDPTMHLQALPGSTLPGELIELGYLVTRTGETQRLFTSNREAEMAIVTWGLLMGKTQHLDHPGVFADYLKAWDFDFNIVIDPNNKKRFTVEVKGGFNSGEPN